MCCATFHGPCKCRHTPPLPLPPFRLFHHPSLSVWALLQLHAARVAFLAFAALADVDTTVAPSRRRQLDTDTDTKRDTDGRRDGCGCGDGDGDGDDGGRESARRWPNEKSQRRARNCSAWPITMRQVFLLCGGSRRRAKEEGEAGHARLCLGVWQSHIHSFIQFGVATHFYVSFLCAKCEYECECCLFYCCGCGCGCCCCCFCCYCCCFILLLFFWTCLVFRYFILLLLWLFC